MISFTLDVKVLRISGFMVFFLYNLVDSDEVEEVLEVPVDLEIWSIPNKGIMTRRALIWITLVIADLGLVR